MQSVASQESTSSKSKRTWFTRVLNTPAGQAGKRGLRTAHFTAAIVSPDPQPARIECCTHKHKTFDQASRCAKRLLESKTGKLTTVQRKDAAGQRELF